MKISIITVCFNSAETIADAVESVLSQRRVDLEYIVVDGASTDGTLDVLRSYGSKISRLISEPDGGIYDAMNKGISLVAGDVVGVLNSDDYYADEGVLARVETAFDHLHVDCVYGDLHYVANDDPTRVVRDWKSGPYEEGKFRTGWHPPHPAFFVRRSLYEKLGLFDLNLRIAADYEFMLRVLEKHSAKVAYLPEVLVKMRTGGESNRSVMNILKANIECYRAWRINGYGLLTALGAVICKPLGKLRQLRAPSAR